MSATRREFLSSAVAIGCLPLAAGVVVPAGGADDIAETEYQVLVLTNRERVRLGVAPLVWSDAVATVARLHSADMQARGFFDHQTPEGLTPGGRAARHGIRFDFCAENLFSFRTAPAGSDAIASGLVKAWMYSAGHRQNLLAADARYVGVGLAGAERALMATQLFIG